MFCDDIFAVSMDFNHSKSVIGYIGDESPKYYTHSNIGYIMDASAYPGTAPNPEGMQIEGEGGENPAHLFGESMLSNIKGTEVDSILENGNCNKMIKLAILGYFCSLLCFFVFLICF